MLDDLDREGTRLRVPDEPIDRAVHSWRCISTGASDQQRDAGRNPVGGDIWNGELELPACVGNLRRALEIEHVAVAQGRAADPRRRGAAEHTQRGRHVAGASPQAATGGVDTERVGVFVQMGQDGGGVPEGVDVGVGHCGKAERGQESGPRAERRGVLEGAPGDVPESRIRETGHEDDGRQRPRRGNAPPFTDQEPDIF